MEVVWNGKGSLHDLFTSERDQLLFQVRGNALSEHAPHAATTRHQGGPGRGRKTEIVAHCKACGDRLTGKWLNEGRVRCRPCGQKFRVERSTAKAKLELDIQRLRQEGKTLHQIVADLHTSLRMVYRVLRSTEVVDAAGNQE